MSKYLINKGVAGLGNRLITVAAAIEYAKKEQRILFIDWSDGVYSEKGINTFFQFFQLRDVEYITEWKTINISKKSTYYPLVFKDNELATIYDLFHAEESVFFQKISRFNPKGTLGKLLGYWHPNKTLKTKNKDIDALIAIFRKNAMPFGGFLNSRKEDLVFFADFYPFYKPEILNYHIQLQVELQNKIDTFAFQHNLSNGVIGVHIRSTDKIPAASVKTVFKIISQICNNTPSIFLATDAPEVEIEFKKKYKKVITYPKLYPSKKPADCGLHHYAIRTGDYSYAKKQLEDSIFDMYLLAKYEFLIYQKNSSFSEVSAVLKNMPEKTFFW